MHHEIISWIDTQKMKQNGSENHIFFTVNPILGQNKVALTKFVLNLGYNSAPFYQHLYFPVDCQSALLWFDYC